MSDALKSPSSERISMVPIENGFAKPKFGTELHMEVHNGCVLARIKDMYLLRWQRYSRWCPAAILNNSFFIFHETEMKLGKNLQIQVLDDSVCANFSNYFEE